MRRSRKSQRSDNRSTPSPSPSARPSQAEINRQLRSWPPRRIASWALMIGGVVIAGQHLVAHAGFRPLPVSMGWQDIFFGYPMAGLVAVVGAVLIDARPRI